jgi:phosphopentomutase
MTRQGLTVHALGKIEDIFSGRGISTAVHTVSNRDGIEKTILAIRDRQDDFVFTNLVDFDTKYGHRNDVTGYARCLEELDAFIPEMVSALKPGDLLVFTADHGGDPSDESTDHTREYVPMVAAGPGVAAGADIGSRRTFADIGATVAEHLGVPSPGGTSFLAAIRQPKSP